MALKLIQNYESDPDESSSSKEETDDFVGEGQESPTRDRDRAVKQRLPLPSALKDMFLNSDKKDDSTQIIENPLEHDGRVRSFAHIRGNWPSFVHISLNSSEAASKHKNVLEMTLDDIPDHGILLCSDIHLSLTKTVVFRHHWIDAFLLTLKEKISIHKRFQIVYDEFEAYVNEENTRTFIGMKVHTCNDLQLLIRDCDDALAEYNLEPYYKDASFHVSIAWTLGSKSTWLNKNVLPRLNVAWRNILEEDPSLQLEQISAINLKTGNKSYEFSLK